MYNLAEFSLQDMTACSTRLRRLGTGASSIDEVANRLVRHLHDHLIDDRTRKPACALVRLFRTQTYGDLSVDSQACVQKALNGEPASPEMKCLGLAATAGVRLEWNHIPRSQVYQAIPLLSAEFLTHFPMFSQLFTQLGVDLDTTLRAGSNLLRDADEHTFNVFHVPHALGSPFVPVQQDFVIPCGIRSVLGFGGLLPTGNLFTVVLFSKVFLSSQTADLFKTLALSARLALLPFDGTPMVHDSEGTTRNGRDESRHYGSQVAALEQLLAVHEEAVMTYATQRERAEEALQESEAKLSAVVHSTKDVALFIDHCGIIKSWNDSAEGLFGYSTQEVYGQPCTMILTKECKDAFERSLQVAATDPMPSATGTTFESVGRKKDGSTFALELSLAAWKTTTNPIILATARDITERKRVEAALEQSESRLRNLIEHAPDAIFTLSMEGLITSLNPAFGTMTHWSPVDWIGQPFERLVHPDDMMTARDILDYSLHNQCPITCVVRIRSQDRGILMGEFVWTPLIEDRQVVGLLAIGRDISDRKMIETALRESEDQLRLIVQSTKDAIISLDRHGQVVFWNRGAEEIFGYAAEQMLGQPLSRVIPERFREAHRQGILRAATAGHLTVSGTMFELVGLRQDGTEFPLEFTLAAWKAQSGLFFTGIIRDITERKRSEDALNALVKGTASVTGEDFFPVLVRQLAAALEVSYAFVTELVHGSRTKLRLLASWEKTAWGKTFEYESNHTPCGIVLRDGMAYYARDVQHAFPDDQHLVDLAISSYLAVAIVNSAGEIIGHVCVMDAHPLKHGQHATGIMNVFAARAGAELERLHTTAALQQSEARQALILNSLPIAFYTSNSSGDGGSTWVSENLERLTGFASCRFLDDPGFWAARLHSEDRERVLSEVKRGRDVGTVSVEYRWQIADGSYRWYLDNAVYTRDVHGTLQELIGARIDITHRKRTEEALRESETRFKAFMDHNPAVIFMKDEEGRHVYVNREFERVLGLAEWVGKTDEELWSHDMAKQFRRNDQEVVTSDATIDVVETTVSRTGVRQFWRVIKFPIADVAGKRYLGGIAVDMTDRKQVEEALRESQERLALCIRGSDVGIWDWDMRREVVYFSPRWKQMLGYEDAEIQNRFEEWEARIHPDDRGPALSMLRSYVEGRQPHYHLEHRMQHKDGTYRWILSHGACLRDCDGTPFRMAGSHLDITERKQIEEELKSSLTRLRSLSGRLETVREEERRRIARELHDEFGVGLTCLKMDLSRLTVFIGHTGALEKGRQIDEKIRSMQDFIDVTIGSIQRIVTELRPAILDDLGLAAAIEWQAQDFQRRTGIPCTLQWREDHLDMDAECATAVFRICQEALTNVARHANATTVAIRLEARQGRLLLEVRDNGCGIAEEQIADPRSLGLLGMRERAESIGGLVTIAGRREAGTAVTLHVQCLRPSSLVEGS